MFVVVDVNARVRVLAHAHTHPHTLALFNINQYPVSGWNKINVGSQGIVSTS